MYVSNRVWVSLLWTLLWWCPANPIINKVGVKPFFIVDSTRILRLPNTHCNPDPNPNPINPINPINPTPTPHPYPYPYPYYH